MLQLSLCLESTSVKHPHTTSVSFVLIIEELVGASHDYGLMQAPMACISEVKRSLDRWLLRRREPALSVLKKNYK